MKETTTISRAEDYCKTLKLNYLSFPVQSCSHRRQDPHSLFYVRLASCPLGSDPKSTKMPSLETLRAPLSHREALPLQSCVLELLRKAVRRSGSQC